MKSAQTGGTASTQRPEGSESCAADFVKRSAGRPRKLSQRDADEIREFYLTNPCSVRELARIFGISRSTVWRAVAGS